MKKLNILVAFLLIANTTFAQKIIEKNIEYSNQYISIDVKFANKIEVKTWNKSTVYFKASVYTEDDQFQDLYTLDIDKSANNIYIVSEAEPVFKAYRKDCLKKNPNRKRNCYNTGDLTEFNYTIYIPKNAQFKVSSINGDLTSEIIEGDFEADLINGDIDIAKYSGNLDLSSINGEIDLKMVNANLVAETIHGDIYADEKLKFTSKDRHVGQKIYGTIDNATNRLRLKTINGNMYLRR